MTPYLDKRDASRFDQSPDHALIDREHFRGLLDGQEYLEGWRRHVSSPSQ